MSTTENNNLVIISIFLILAAGFLLASCSHPVGPGQHGQASPMVQRGVPTNSLDFHLQSLGHSPTDEERQIIESALGLLRRYQVRSDSPLRSVRYDRNASEWILHFDNGDPDGTFTIFLRDKEADWFDIQHTMLESRRIRVSSGTRQK